MEITGLLAAAIGAGMVNAIAGGGTLITFPVLLMFGTGSITANATSTVALFLGTLGSMYGYRRQLAAVGFWLKTFLPASVVGGWIGSYLLTRTSEAAFSSMVPFLILFATVLFFAQGAFRRFSKQRATDSPAGTRGIWVAIAFQFAVAVYGGYFGAGIGILMLASLGFLGLSNIHEMNGLKTVLGALINMVAAIWFSISGLVDWPRAGVMTAGALAGYFVGAHYAQRFSQQRVRQSIACIGFAISAIMFYRQFS